MSTHVRNSHGSVTLQIVVEIVPEGLLAARLLAARLLASLLLSG